MSKPITEGPIDGAGGNARSTADTANIDANADADTDADVDHSDEYDLFDRSNLYAKAEESYKHDWKKPSSRKLSLQEVDEDKIRGFDSNDDSPDDSYHRGDNHKGHPPPDGCCIRPDLDLSAMLVKERRTKKILLLSCFLLSVICISLLFDPQSRILSPRGAAMPYINTQYVRTDGDHDSEGEEHDLENDSYEEASPQDTAQTNQDFGVAQEFANEDSGGDYPLEPSDTVVEEWGNTGNDSPQDPMAQQQPQQPLPEEKTEQEPWLKPENQVGVGADVFLDNNDSTQDQSGREAIQPDDSQVMFGNTADGSNVANDAISSPDNDESELGFVEGQNEEISPLQMATRFRSLDTYKTQPNGDLPLFWYIPKTGSNIVEDIMMQCFALVGVTHKSGLNAPEDDNAPPEIYTSADARKYVNVDISSPQGRQSAVNRGFVRSNLANIIISPLIRDVSTMFDDSSTSNFEDQQQQQFGRCLTLFRNPIDRAASVYYQLQSNNEKWKDSTIDSYAKSTECESNWMVRELTGKLFGGTLTPDDTNQARAFIRDYCVIGLEEEMDASIQRFQDVFGWESEANRCIETTLRYGVMDTSSFEKFTEGSYIWKLFYEKNKEDWNLYQYAVQLFNERGGQ